MLDFISIGSVFTVKFRSCCFSRVDPIVGSSLSVAMLSSVAVDVLFWSPGSSRCFAILVLCVLSTVSSSFPVLFSGSISLVLFRFVSACSVVLLIPGCFGKLRWWLLIRFNAVLIAHDLQVDML